MSHLYFYSTDSSNTLFRRLVSYGLQKPTNADIAPLHSFQWSSLRANPVLSQLPRETDWKARNLLWRDPEGVAPDRMVGLLQSVERVVF